jgi:molybdopterin-binding protein
MALVAVRVGENIIESVITRASAEGLGLKVGDEVRVVIKSTEVMIQKD